MVFIRCNSKGEAGNAIFGAENLLTPVNDVINAHSQINALYLIDAPFEVYSLY